MPKTAPLAPLAPLHDDSTRDELIEWEAHWMQQPTSAHRAHILGHIARALAARKSA